MPVTDITPRAMHEISIYVAKTLFKQEALILPSVHEHFTSLTLGAHAGLCVCLCVDAYSRTTGNEAADERYQRL